MINRWYQENTDFISESVEDTLPSLVVTDTLENGLVKDTDLPLFECPQDLQETAFNSMTAKEYF